MYARFFFFKQKTAYEMRISDWSSDVCSSDLLELPIAEMGLPIRAETRTGDTPQGKRQRQRRTPPHILLTTPESLALLLRSEERRVGKEGVSTCRSRRSPYL